MDNRIRPLLDRYADFYFKIDTNEWGVSFLRVPGAAAAGREMGREAPFLVVVSHGCPLCFLSRKKCGR